MFASGFAVALAGFMRHKVVLLLQRGMMVETLHEKFLRFGSPPHHCPAQRCIVEEGEMAGEHGIVAVLSGMSLIHAVEPLTNMVLSARASVCLFDLSGLLHDWPAVKQTRGASEASWVCRCKTMALCLPSNNGQTVIR